MHTPYNRLLDGLDEVVAVYCPSSFQSPRDVLSNAIVLPRRGRVGVVLLMPTQGLVLKVYRGPNNGIQNELRADRVARKAGLSGWLPRVLGSGELPNSRYFIAQSFSANEARTPGITSRRWRAYCTQTLWPVLLRLHMIADPQVVSFDYSLAHLWQSVRGHPDEAILQQVLSLIEINSNLSSDNGFVVSETHGDIVPEHIRVGTSQTTIIDWGSFARRPAIAEYCLRFTRSARRADLGALQFWLRIRTPAMPLPNSVTSLTQNVAEWQRQHFGLSVDDNSIKAQLLLDFCNAAVWRWKHAGRDLSAKKYRQRIERMGLDGAS